MKKTVLITALTAGTLDISAAFIQSYLVADVMPSRVLKYIASGVFGSDALNGGIGMAAFGLLAHFIIAFSCTICFFWAYPRWKFLTKSIVLNSILIALTAWIVTTHIIVPLSRIKQGSFDLSKALMAIAILIVCIGLPIAIGANQYYAKNKR